MNSIDDDARLLGIDNDLWKEFKKSPKYVEQPEFPEIVDDIDDKEAFIRHKKALAKRWFGYYRKCKYHDKKIKLVDQYNFLAQSRQR